VNAGNPTLLNSTPGSVSFQAATATSSTATGEVLPSPNGSRI
jgi:hypothetical protein